MKIYNLLFVGIGCMSLCSAAVRSKAIEIANALLAEGYDEGKAIRIALPVAGRWAQRCGISFERELENHDR